MNHIKEAQAVDYRIDITPDQAGMSLSRQISIEKGLVAEAERFGEGNLFEAYNAAIADNKIVDVGYEGEDGSYMRAIVASADNLHVFFPAYVDSTKPYKTTIYSQEDVVGFIKDQDFIDARKSGVLLEVGISHDGSHRIASPLDFKMPHERGE